MKLKYNIIVLFLLTCLTSGFGQNCYIVEVDHVGAGAFYHDLLDVVSCELKDSITKNTTDDFKVLAYNLYPVLGAVDKEIGLDGTLEKIDEELASKENYLAIIKKINFEDDPYSTTPSHSIEYILKLNLPDNENNQLSELDKGALMESLHSQAAEDFAMTGNTIVTEAAIMQKLAKSLDGFTVEDNFKTLGYTFMPEAYEGQLKSEGLDSPIGFQFAKIEIKEDGSNYFLNVSQMYGITNEFSVSSLNHGEYYLIDGITPNLITSTSLSPSSLENAFIETQNIVDFQFNIHIHHDHNAKGLYFKFDLTENTANFYLEEIVKALHQISNLDYPGLESDINTIKGNDGNTGEKRVSDEWNYGKKFMESGTFTALFGSSEYLEYGGAIGCGVADGLLGDIELLWKLVEGIISAAEAVIEGGEAFNQEIEEKGFFNAVGQGIIKGIDWTTELYYDIKDGFLIAKAIWDGTSAKDVEEFFNMACTALLKWFAPLITLTKEGGYRIGGLAYEIIVNFFTFGAKSGGTGAKLLNEVVDLLKSGKLKSVAGKLDKILDSSKSVAELNKKIDRCHTFGKGCFIENTKVSIASLEKDDGVTAAYGIEYKSIQEIELLDYVVSHKYVNQRNNLTANLKEEFVAVLGTNPYTSEDQIKRDKYDIHQGRWFEVTFDQMNGGSQAKFALNEKWIEKKGYKEGGIAKLLLPEQGVNGLFRITSIRHIIPQKVIAEENEIESGDYALKPITALFLHQTDEIYNVKLHDGEIIGVTYNHPIYSATQNDWKLAGELYVGERVLTVNGSAEIVDISKEVGERTVYNLEVKDFHNYIVGINEIVVHNDYAKGVIEKVALELKDLEKYPNGPTKGSLKKLNELLKSVEEAEISLAERFLESFKQNVPLLLGPIAMDMYKNLELKGKDKIKESECFLELAIKLQDYPDFYDELLERLDEDELEDFCSDFVDAETTVYDEFEANLEMVKSWKVLLNLGADLMKRIDIDFLANIAAWDDVDVTLSLNSSSNLQLNHSGIKIGEFKNDNLIPEYNKYDYSPNHSYTGTKIGEPINGYQLIDKGSNRKLRRVPDKSAYLQNEINALTNHPKSHTLERHGHDVSDDALVRRAETPSYAPDGKQNPSPPSYSSKFETPDRLKDALDKTGPNSSSWNPPNNPVNGHTYPRSYVDPNQTPFGYGVPAGGGVSNKVQMHKVEAFYNYQTATNKWELSTMYPTI